MELQLQVIEEEGIMLPELTFELVDDLVALAEDSRLNVTGLNVTGVNETSVYAQPCTPLCMRQAHAYACMCAHACACVRAHVCACALVRVCTRARVLS